MSENIPTPSTELSRISTQLDIADGIPAGEERRYNLLEAQEAAYAAKPFMDVAVDLYNAQEDDAKDLALKGSLSGLIDYAEQRARLAAEKGEVRELSDDERAILDVYEAETEASGVKAELGDVYDNADHEDAIAAATEANDQFRQATTREEKRKWGELERKLERYADYLKSGQETQLGEFSSDTEYAAGLLGRMNPEAGKAIEWNGEPHDPKKLLLTAHNLRTEAEMLSFLGSHIKLEKQKEMIADTSTSRRLGEGRADNESPPQEQRELRYDVVDTVAEAKELIYSNPDYLGELIDESEAYAKFKSDKVDTSNAAIGSNLKTMERDLPEVRQIAEDWRTAESGMNFKQYIEAVAEGDIDTTQEQQNAARSAKLMLRNMFWRESPMARRMAKKIVDKSETSDVDRAFSDEYFDKN